MLSSKYLPPLLVLLLLGNVTKTLIEAAFCEPDDLNCEQKPVGPDHDKYNGNYHHKMKYDIKETPIQIPRNISSTLTLNDGVEMPLFGLGMCCDNPDWNVDIQEVMTLALDHGYIMFDTAASYNTEIETGDGIKNYPIERKDVFVVTKLWNDQHGKENVNQAFHKSLSNLDIGYVDLYLIHSPYGGKILETYDAMLDLKEQGFIRSVGVSIFGIQHLEGIKQSGRPLPSVNQIELHPWQRKEHIVEYCRQEGVAVMGYSPLTRGIKLDDPDLVSIAQRYGVTTAQLLIRWSVQSGFITIPKSFKHDRIIQNAKVFDWSISEEDFSLMNSFPDWSCSWDPTVEPWEG